MTTPPPPPAAPPPPTPPPPPPIQPPGVSPIDRIRAASQQRASTDYVFSGPGMNIFLTIITCGIFGFILFYQLMKRDREHNRRRFELLDATNTYAWDRALDGGIADELRPSFERNAANLAVLRSLTMEFRDPGIWVVISIFASSIAYIVGFIFIDQDLERHDRAEVAIESELAAIFARLGMSLPTADASRIKGKHNYAGRIIATIASCGFYYYWWLYDMQVEGNAHLEQNWPWEDALQAALPAA
jgi:hypothetical protein